MDPNQNNNQNQPPALAVQQAVPQPDESQGVQAQQVVTPPQATQTVTAGGKEGAPVVIQGDPQEYMQPPAHESAPVVPEAVREAGVDATPQQEQVKLSQEDQQAGLQAAKESVQMPAAPSQQTVLSSPLTLPQAEQAAAGKANDSGTWLGKLVEFVFGQQPYKNEVQ